MRRFACLLVVASCGRIDFAARDVDDAPADASTLGPACPSDPRLLACFDFEGDAVDATGNANHGVPTGVTFSPGLDGLAAEMTANSRIDLANPTLIATAVTIDAWIEPASNAEQLVFDHDGHWAMNLDAGRARCFTSATGTFVEGTTTLELGRWVHIACTIDDANTGNVFVNGRLDGTGTAGVLPGNAAAAIGGNAPADDVPFPFLGRIDRLRIWSTVLSAAELCEAAGGCPP